MTLVEDARRLGAMGTPTGYRPPDPALISLCCGHPFDRRLSYESVHFDTCPTRAIPRIVAVLEAAERVADDATTRYKYDADTCLVGVDEIQALVSALSGEDAAHE